MDVLLVIVEPFVVTVVSRTTRVVGFAQILGTQPLSATTMLKRSESTVAEGAFANRNVNRYNHTPVSA
jgi:hypothetical protein